MYLMALPKVMVKQVRDLSVLGQASTIITKRVNPLHAQFIYSLIYVNHPLRTKFRPIVPVTGGGVAEVVWRGDGTARTTPGR